MLHLKQVLEIKRHANPKQRMIYEAFKEKIKSDSLRSHILAHFDYLTFDDTLPLMEVYVNDILSSEEFKYMVSACRGVSDACIQAFIDGMTLDDADWLLNACLYMKDIVEKAFFLITHGYSREQIEPFAYKYYALLDKADDAKELYDVVLGCPNISAKEIELCANFIRNKVDNNYNTNLFLKLVKLEVGPSELEEFFKWVNVEDYSEQEIIEAALDFKLIYSD